MKLIFSHLDAVYNFEDTVASSALVKCLDPEQIEELRLLLQRSQVFSQLLHVKQI